MKLPKELREKSDLSGAVKKSRKCSIIDCNEFAIRSLSDNKWGNILKKTGLKYEENKLRKIFLCKEHYKTANKKRKSDDKLIQKKGFLQDSLGPKKGRWE